MSRSWLPPSASVMRNAAASTLSTVAVVASATPHTKGSWATLIASTAIETSEAHLIQVGTSGASATNSATLLDLAIGPSGSPTMLVENMQVGWSTHTVFTCSYPFWRLPIRIPAGVEIIARQQSAIVSKSITYCLDLYGGPDATQHPGFAKCRTIGANTATSRGITLTAPGSNNTKSAWTVMEASTAEPIFGFSFGLGCDGDTTVGNQTYFLDIGAGAASAEAVICPDIFFATTSAERVVRVRPAGRYYPLDCALPAGSRLVARYANSGAQGIDLILYGWS